MPMPSPLEGTISLLPNSPSKGPLIFNANVIALSLLLLKFIPDFMSWTVDSFPAFWYAYLDRFGPVGAQLLEVFAYSLSFSVAILVPLNLLKMPAKIAFPTSAPQTDVLIGSVGIALGAIILGAMLTNSMGMLLTNLTGYRPTSPSMDPPRGLAPNAIYFVHMAVLPALLEEGLFRGVILQSLRRFGDGFALITSAVLFGLIHGNFIQMPYTLFLGFILAYFVLYTGSLWPAIAIHFVNNGLSVITEWVTRGTTATTDQWLSIVFLLARLIIGLVSLFVLRHRLGSLFYIPPSTYPLKEREKHVAFYTTIGVLLFLIYSGITFRNYLQPYIQAAGA